MDFKLYELTEAYKQLLELQEDVDQETFIDTLDSINDNIEMKVENIVKMLKYYESIVTAIETEEKRLKQRKQVFKNKMDGLKTYAKIQLQQIGKKKIETPGFTVSIRNNPPKVNITDLHLIPKEFLVQPEPIPNKEALKKYLKDGNQLLGAELQVDNSLQIK